MVKTLFFWLVIVFVFAWVLLYYRQRMNDHAKHSHGVRNYDRDMRAFCYHTKKTKAEIWEELEHGIRFTTMKYRFDPRQGVITFYDEVCGYPDVSYRVEVSCAYSCVNLRVTQITPQWKSNQFKYGLNEFWKQKLDAEPMGYISPVEWAKYEA